MQVTNKINEFLESLTPFSKYPEFPFQSYVDVSHEAYTLFVTISTFSSKILRCHRVYLEQSVKLLDLIRKDVSIASLPLVVKVLNVCESVFNNSTKPEAISDFLEDYASLALESCKFARDLKTHFAAHIFNLRLNQFVDCLLNSQHIFNICPTHAEAIGEGLVSMFPHHSPFDVYLRYLHETYTPNATIRSLRPYVDATPEDKEPPQSNILATVQTIFPYFCNWNTDRSIVKVKMFTDQRFKHHESPHFVNYKKGLLFVDSSSTVSLLYRAFITNMHCLCAFCNFTASEKFQSVDPFCNVNVLCNRNLDPDSNHFSVNDYMWVPCRFAQLFNSNDTHTFATKYKKHQNPNNSNKPKYYRICSGCAVVTRQGSEGNTFGKCAGCLAYAYCNEECQKLHWRSHKHHCFRLDKKKKKKKKKKNKKDKKNKNNKKK